MNVRGNVINLMSANLLLGIGLAGCLVSCSLLDWESDQSDDLIPSSWKLVSINENDQVPEDQPLILYFEPDGHLGARVLCNSAGGSFSALEGGKLSINIEQSTYVGCQQDALEERYYSFFSSPVDYELRGDSLILRVGQGGQTTLTFTRLEEEAGS